MLLAVGAYMMLNNDGDDSNAPGDGDGPGDGNNQISDEWDVYYVPSGTDLPACGSTTLGRLYYVVDTAGFETCTSAGWEFVDLTGPAGPAGASGSDGVNGSDGSPGLNGTDGISFISVTAVEPPGDNCSEGGTRIMLGTDDDGDMELSVGEIFFSDLICNDPVVYTYSFSSSNDISIYGSAAQELFDGDVNINGFAIRGTYNSDDSLSPPSSPSMNGFNPQAASAIAKVAAINDMSGFTGVIAVVLPTVVTGAADIAEITLDSTNLIVINGVVITGFTVLDNDAMTSSMIGPRLAEYTSITDIQASNAADCLFDTNVEINDVPIRSTLNSDDTLSTSNNCASAIAKAAAINDSTFYTGVTASAQPTVVTGAADISEVTLDSSNLIIINGVVITGFTVLDNDAMTSSMTGPRLAEYTSISDIQASNAPDCLVDEDVKINDVVIRSTVNSDDTLSISNNCASAIAKAAAINDSTFYTGVTASAQPTVVTGAADISEVTLDSQNSIAINGILFDSGTVLDDDSDNTLRNMINQETATTGVTALLNQNNRLVLTASDGRNIEITQSGSSTFLGLYAAAGTTVTGGKLTLTSNDTFAVWGNAIDKLGDVGGYGQTMFGSVLVDGTENIRSAINGHSAQTGVFASLDDDHRLVLTAPDGRNIEITQSGNAARLGLYASSGTTVTGGKLTLTSNDTFSMGGGGFDKLGNVGGYGQTMFGSVLVDGTENIRSAINAHSAQTGVFASLDDDHRLVLTAPDGRNIEITQSGSSTFLGLYAAAGTTVTGGRIMLSSDAPFTISGNAIDKLGHIGSEGETEFPPEEI
jgi:hypothetical protein